MGRKSSIERLDPRLREAIDALLREGRWTLDEILDHLRTLGAGTPPSRSALGRYAKGAQAQLAKFREAQEVAKVWIGKLESEPEGDVARLLPEMLRAVAFQSLSQLGEQDAVDTRDIALLAKAIKDASGATKSSVETELKLREVRRTLDRVETEAKAGRRSIDLDTLRQIREELYGIAA